MLKLNGTPSVQTFVVPGAELLDPESPRNISSPRGDAAPASVLYNDSLSMIFLTFISSSEMLEIFIGISSTISGFFLAVTMISSMLCCALISGTARIAAEVATVAATLTLFFIRWIFCFLRMTFDLLKAF